MPTYGQNWNRNLNAELDLEPSGNPATRLMMRMYAIQERKKDRERQAELDRQAEEDRQRRLRDEEEARQIRLAETAARFAALVDRPKEKKTVDETVASAQLKSPVAAPMTADELAVHQATGEPAGLAPMTPDEQAVHDATGTPAPLDQLDIGGRPEDVQGVPDAIPLTAPITKEVATPTPMRRVQLGDLTLDMPLYDRSETIARQEQDAQRAVNRKVAEQKAIDQATRTFTVPNDPKYGELAGLSLPEAAVPAVIRSLSQGDDPFSKVKGVGGGYLTADDKGGLTFHDTTPPTGTPAGEKRKWVTNLKTGQREYVTEEQMATADPGTYSDTKPPSARVVKADPAKLRMAVNALGGPDVPNSLWYLATQINQGKGMWEAIKGVGKRKMTEIAPEMATHSSDAQTRMIRAYNRQIQGFASAIAKAFGESGVLTNQDIARATGLFPRPGESPESTLEALQRIQQVMNAGMTDPAVFREIFDRDPKPEGGSGTPAMDPEVQKRVDKYGGNP